jgi:hypothetical protein
MPKLPPTVTAPVRVALDEFLAELDRLGYERTAIDTYDKTIDRFLRWTEGTFTPAGPRGRRSAG